MYIYCTNMVHTLDAYAVKEILYKSFIHVLDMPYIHIVYAYYIHSCIYICYTYIIYIYYICLISMESGPRAGEAGKNPKNQKPSPPPPQELFFFCFFCFLAWGEGRGQGRRQKNQKTWGPDFLVFCVGFLFFWLGGRAAVVGIFPKNKKTSSIIPRFFF